METLDSRTDEIASWDLAQQENLLHKFVNLNYQRGSKKLSEQIRQRLAAESKLDQSVDEIFAELAQTRDAIAADDYKR